MQGLQVLVAGVAIPHQHTGELSQHPAGVDRGRTAVTNVHQRQVFGAGHVHVGQGTGGAAGGFVGV